MLATHQKLLTEAERMTALMTTEPNPSASRKKRAREARKLEARVKAAIEEGRIEEDIPGVKLEKVYSRESTKQVMIARVSTPPSLCNRCSCHVDSTCPHATSQPLRSLRVLRLQEHMPCGVL